MMMTTYIIDDDEVYVMGVKRMLAKTNLSSTVLVFENGLKALEYISDNVHEVPDTILLDINMPVMDGWQFLDGFSKVKKGFNKKVTIYMVSSSINPVDLERAKSYSDVTDYIFKPITPSDLQRLLVH